MICACSTLYQAPHHTLACRDIRAESTIARPQVFWDASNDKVPLIRVVHVGMDKCNVRANEKRGISLPKGVCSTTCS